MSGIFHIKLFDGTVPGLAACTPTDLERTLGDADLLALHMVCDPGTGIVPSICVKAEHSADGRTWANRSASPEIDTPPMTTPALVVRHFATSPSLPFVRFRMAAPDGVLPRGDFAIYAIARKR